MRCSFFPNVSDHERASVNRLCWSDLFALRVEQGLLNEECEVMQVRRLQAGFGLGESVERPRYKRNKQGNYFLAVRFKKAHLYLPGVNFCLVRCIEFRLL